MKNIAVPLAFLVGAILVLMVAGKLLGYNITTSFVTLTQVAPSVDLNSASPVLEVAEGYKTTKTLLNNPEQDSVVATCPKDDERAISGLCYLDSPGKGDGWGWLLQNAGIVGPKSWGCSYRRSVYISPKDGTTGEPEKNEGPNDARDRITSARGSASATASVLCVNVRKGT